MNISSRKAKSLIFYKDEDLTQHLIDEVNKLEKGVQLNVSL